MVLVSYGMTFHKGSPNYVNFSTGRVAGTMIARLSSVRVNASLNLNRTSAGAGWGLTGSDSSCQDLNLCVTSKGGSW